MSAFGIVVGALASTAGTASAQTAEEDLRAAERAAREIEATHRRAEAAAAAFADAETELAGVERELEQAEVQQQAAGQRLVMLQADLQALALQRYVQGDIGSLPTAQTVSDAADVIRADFFARLVALGSNELLDEVGMVRDDLDERTAALGRARRRADGVRASLDRARHELDERLRDLEEAERQRQADAAVRRILEARRAEELRQQAEAEAAARAQAEAERAAQQRAAEEQQRAAQAQADSQRLADQQAQAPTAAARTAPTPSPPVAAPRPTAPAATSPPARPAPPRPNPSPTPPPPAPAPTPPSPTGMVCPVAGASVFVDTWGAPRSGGRRHEGVDMLGTRGTPIVAVVAGTAVHRNNSLGGNAVWLTGANGTTYYYAHLDQFAASGPVAAGTVIGTMGDTGNARGTVHLHFEVHPGGGRAVNPTPYVRAVC